MIAEKGLAQLMLILAHELVIVVFKDGSYLRMRRHNKEICVVTRIARDSQAVSLVGLNYPV